MILRILLILIESLDLLEKENCIYTYIYIYRYKTLGHIAISFVMSISINLLIINRNKSDYV